MALRAEGAPGLGQDVVVTVLIVQHLPIEGPYRLGSALVRAGVELDVRRVYAGDEVPSDAAGLSGLVVMGGPMAAHDDAGFPTRRAELALLADAVQRTVPTVGICLGAQLLAVAAGGSAFPGPRPEVGWGPVTLTAAADADAVLAGLPTEHSVLHWHGDTVTLPPHAERLAGNENYENQAFRVGARAWGFQFHPEVDRAGVDAFVREFADEAPGATGQQILDESAAAVEKMDASFRVVFERFAVLAANA